jgi:hypothetical protein
MLKLLHGNIWRESYIRAELGNKEAFDLRNSDLVSQLNHKAVNDWFGVVPEPTNPTLLVLRDHSECGSYNSPMLAACIARAKSWEMHGQLLEPAKEILWPE